MPFSPTVKLTQTCGSADTDDNDAEQSEKCHVPPALNAYTLKPSTGPGWTLW